MARTEHKTVRAFSTSTKRFRPAVPVLGRNGKALCVFLGLSTLLIYLATIRFQFVFYDDDTFVYDNPFVKAGLKLSSMAWAFGMHFANWHPLTWLSYLLDAQLFGMNAGAFHAVNLLLHAGSTVLLFLALYRMTGRMWRCAIVAALFAWHPLHVESVAWVAERKDVLSTFFEMAALLLYARYIEDPSPKRYALVFVAFVCGLMAKPMLVTFPLLLLLLDFWPLGRIQWPMRWPIDWRPVLEKGPLLAISFVASIIAVIAQREFGTVATLQGVPLSARLATAVTAYATYLRQTFWPANLGVLYPVETPARSAVVLSTVVLAVITAVVVRLSLRHRYLFTGWFWFLGVLVPVIGLVQVGVQSRADRYMYVPMVGLTIALVWAAGDWLDRHTAWCRPAVAVTAIAMLALVVGAWRQLQYWKDSRTLFEHTLAVTDRNYIIQNNLGVILARAGDNRSAMAHYMRAMLINPKFPLAKGNVGQQLLRSGQAAAARPVLLEAIQLKPDFPMALLDVGIAEASLGLFPDSITHLEEALKYNPQDAVGHSNLCYSLEHAGRLDEALLHCRQALRLQPNYPEAQFNLKNVMTERAAKNAGWRK